MADVIYRQVVPSDIPTMARIRAANWGSEEYWIARITGYLNCTIHPGTYLLVLG